MSLHPSRPWGIIRDTRGFPKFIVDNTRNQIIAQIPDGITEPEEVARLFRAAPDLLQVAESANRIITMTRNQLRSLPEFGQEPDLMKQDEILALFINFAREAISAAKGPQ